MTDQIAPVPHRVLAIECPEAQQIGASLDPPALVLAIAYRQLSRALLELVAPDCVALPLFTAGFDAVQAIERLGLLGYRGRICAFAPDLPDPALVEAELTALTGGCPVSVITPGRAPDHRSR